MNSIKLSDYLALLPCENNDAMAAAIESARQLECTVLRKFPSAKNQVTFASTVGGWDAVELPRNDMPTTPNPWQPPPGTEWAIVRSGKTTERWRTRYAASTPWAVSPFYDHAARFKTRMEAEDYIDGHGLTDCQPWPVPLS